MSRESSVSKLAMDLMFGVRSLAGVEIFSSAEHQIAFLKMDRVGKAPINVKLTIHVRLVARLRERKALPPHPNTPI
jgi:hypothetical protein